MDFVYYGNTVSSLPDGAPARHASVLQRTLTQFKVLIAFTMDKLGRSACNIPAEIFSAYAGSHS